AADGGVDILREEARIIVDGEEEIWRLVWRTAPELACIDEQWWTCPCLGFAFGESGKLDLIRLRPGKPPQRLLLGDAHVQRWKPTDAEKKEAWGSTTKGAPPVAELARRPVVKVMSFGDYDHDGRATEFVLQVGAGPCFHKSAVLVGLERTN